MSRLKDGHYLVARLETAFRPGPWDFAEREAERIAALWAQARKQKPKLFDGQVLLMRHAEIVATPDGDVLRGDFFATNFRNFLALFALGAGETDVYNCFSMAALRTRDGAFLLGEMSAHTLNAGQIYFAAGTPDLSDVFGAKVDLGASVAREMAEETGFTAAEAPAGEGWSLQVSGAKIACIQSRLLSLTAEQALARGAEFLARDNDPEFTRLHAVFGPQDIDPARTPDFIQTFLRESFAAQPCG